MTVHVPDVDPLARSLAAEMREMMLQAVCREAAAARKAEVDRSDAEIETASRKVARAADRLVAARYSGAPEGSAHRTLVKVAIELGTVMRKHGRMPKGE